MCWCWLLVVFGVGCWLCRRRVGQRRCAALSRMSRRWPRSARRQPKDTVSLLPSSRLKSATSAAMPPASLTAMHADAELSIPSWRWWRSASRACGAGSSLTMVMSPSCMCDRMRARLASSTRSVAPVRGIPSVGAPSSLPSAYTPPCAPSLPSSAIGALTFVCAYADDIHILGRGDEWMALGCALPRPSRGYRAGSASRSCPTVRRPVRPRPAEPRGPRSWALSLSVRERSALCGASAPGQQPGLGASALCVQPPLIALADSLLRVLQG